MSLYTLSYGCCCCCGGVWKLLEQTYWNKQFSLCLLLEHNSLICWWKKCLHSSGGHGERSKVVVKEKLSYFFSARRRAVSGGGWLSYIASLCDFYRDDNELHGYLPTRRSSRFCFCPFWWENCSLAQISMSSLAREKFEKFCDFLLCVARTATTTTSHTHPKKHTASWVKIPKFSQHLRRVSEMWEFLGLFPSHHISVHFSGPTATSHHKVNEMSPSVASSNFFSALSAVRKRLIFQDFFSSSLVSFPPPPQAGCWVRKSCSSLDFVWFFSLKKSFSFYLFVFLVRSSSALQDKETSIHAQL